VARGGADRRALALDRLGRAEEAMEAARAAQAAAKGGWVVAAGQRLEKIVEEPAHFPQLYSLVRFVSLGVTVSVIVVGWAMIMYFCGRAGRPATQETRRWLGWCVGWLKRRPHTPPPAPWRRRNGGARTWKPWTETLSLTLFSVLFCSTVGRSPSFFVLNPFFLWDLQSLE
jgi:hypothetical protein